MVVICLWLAHIFVSGAIVHQADKPGEFSRSWGVACSRYPHILIASVIVGIISYVLSLIPFVGGIIASMLFLFILQFVVVGRNGGIDAVINSMKTFRHNFINVLISWVLVAIFSLLIVGISSLPAIGYFMNFFITYGEDMSTNPAAIFTGLDMTTMAAIFAILLVGVSIAQTFGIKFLTEIYKQMHRKKYLIF